MALKDEIQNMKTIEQGVANNKVVNFAYTNKAYTDNEVNGVDVYDFNNDNNIPTNNPDVIKVNPTVITKGYRAQASSITRMLVNHIFGRVSYNLNKTVDLFTSLLDKLGNAIGEPNGIATLDVDGRIPYSQLPETAVEYKGEWNAETNTPTLTDGIGTKGDMYYVSTAGTQNLGSGEIVFLAGDRIIYNGSIWQRLSGGSVKKVNNIRPDDTGNVKIDDYISYTYIVDSNQKLLDWANNVEGNDYSSVLIKKGTWTSSVGVNLTSCGTKVVVGEVGSLLAFTNDISSEFRCLYYTEVPKSSEYYMLNVNIIATETRVGRIYGFHSCTNLTNCSCNVTSFSEKTDTPLVETLNNYAYGFGSCTNLTNCSATATATGKVTVTYTSYRNAYGFVSCTNLTNCSATATATGTDTYTSYRNAYGFGSCTNLTNCSATATATGTETETDTSVRNSHAFNTCTNLTNCSGTGTTIGTSASTANSNISYGFLRCTNLTNCSGTGIASGKGIVNGYGFSVCKGVSKCKAGGQCYSTVFYESWASQIEDNTYFCADTANGGFNDTMNPSS